MGIIQSDRQHVWVFWRSLGWDEEDFKLQLIRPPPVFMCQWVTRLPLQNVQNDLLDSTKST